MQLNLKVNEDNYYRRLDRFLRKNTQNLSLNTIYKLIRKGRVKINGKKVRKPGYELKIGDEVSIFLNEEIKIKRKEEKIEAKPLDFKVLYEDSDLLIIDKPAGIAIHPGKGEHHVTLIEGLLYYSKGKFSPHLVHRLDKHTSGVLVIAKNKNSARKLTSLIVNKKMKKYYVTLIIGELKKEGILKSNIDGKVAELKYSPLKIFKTAFSSLTLVEVDLKTGRKHQIRKQFAEISKPVAGDDMYGFLNINKTLRKIYGLKRYFLHAYKITFNFDGKKIKVVAELPDDLNKVLRRLEKNSEVENIKEGEWKND